MNQVEGIAPGPVDGEGPHIGWARAIGSGLAILVVGFVASVYAANSVVTKLTGVSRNTRQYLASVLFLVVVVAMAWVLRRLQGRLI